MPNRGSGGSSGRKRRALLLLSLILLVWNAFATAWGLAPAVFLPPTDGVAAPPNLPTVSGTVQAIDSAESPRSGPLTIRQRYLLGKRVDINKAPAQEISGLPGISDEVAAAVVKERDRLGRFRSPRDLLGVKGIKEGRLQKILPFLSEMPNN